MVSDRTAFIAVDWGTSNCRAMLVSAGRCLKRIDDLPGAQRMGREDFAEVISRIRVQLGDLPMLLSGMVGSTIGWKEASYCSAPAGREELLRGLCWIDHRTAIVPGVAQHAPSRPDVMRGEEVQVLGAAALLGATCPALLCQPGTHSKWIRLRDDRIDEFETSMTGEIFNLLREHSVLASALNAEAEADEYFLLGVEASDSPNLLASLFRVRASSLLEGWRGEAASSYASGLLIGTETRHNARAAETVGLIADDALATLYRAALRAIGAEVVEISARDAFVSGISLIASEALERELNHERR